MYIRDVKVTSLNKQMTKQELLAATIEGLKQDSFHPIIVDNFKCQGHIYSRYPKYEETGYFFRCWIFKAVCLDGELEIVLADLGNQHSGYVCEATEEALDTEIKRLEAKVC